MWRFTYYRISFEDCEGTLCSYQLGEAIIATYRLTSAIFYVLLEWITWCLRPRWWDTSPVEGLGVSDLASMPWADACSSVMPLGATWGSDPGGRFWWPGSSKSSFQASLDWVMLENLLRCHSLARLKIPCVESSEWSSTKFSQFSGTFSFLMCSTLENVLSKTTCYWGKTSPFMVSNTRSNDPAWN